MPLPTLASVQVVVSAPALGHRCDRARLTSLAARADTVVVPRRLSLLLPAVLLLGCAATGLNVDLSVDALEDVNPSSATHGETRHPADYEGAVSAWYFGHAT